MEKSTVAHKASTIAEFCEAHRFSVAYFYELLKAGKAPRIIKLGSRRIISEEDAADWRRRMAEASEAACVGV